MSDTPTRGRGGRRPSGQPPKVPIGFIVTREDKEYLVSMPNRSAWLAQKVAEDRAKSEGGSR